MAVKELLHRLQPVQIYLVLVLSIVYFCVQLFLSHVTHALTLLICAYHMLCNIVALTGCIITIKHCDNYDNNRSSTLLNDKVASQLTIGKPFDDNKVVEINDAPETNRERSLRNTFGWTRIDILTMLIVGIFLAAFCFSTFVESVQMLIHIDHQDTMHLPVAVFALSVVGLLLNGFCYLVIGGYSHHQENFLHITPTGDVTLDRDEMRRSSRRLSFKSKHNDNGPNSIVTMHSNHSIQSEKNTEQLNGTTAPTQAAGKQKQLLIREIMRDISSTIFVLICSLLIYFADNENITKYIDPIMSIISCITLLVLSYPFMKESCLILLQTIPASIDIELFKSDLLKTFDDIVSVHDLHIWQMTSRKYVSTVHILFHSPSVYVEIKDSLVSFFHAQGITIVTIQPEFKTNTTDAESKTGSKNLLTECLIGCQSNECLSKTCCSTNDLHVINIDDSNNGNVKSAPGSKKSTSLASLNLPALPNSKRITGSTQSVIKKSVSESHVGNASAECTTHTENAVSTASDSTIHSTAEQTNESHYNDNEAIDSNTSSSEQLSITPKSAQNAEESNLLDRQKTDADQQFTAELKAEIEEQIKRT